MFEIHGFLDIDLAAIGRRDDLHDRQAVLLGKFPIARIVTRDSHHGARAVTHQYKVGDPQRHLFTGQWMDGRNAQRHALLFHRFERCFGRIRLFALFDECRNLGIVAAAFVASGCSAATAM